MLSDKIIMKEIQNNMRQIRKYGICKIGLFGSFASGRARRGSDIDILVHFEKGKKTFDNYMDAKFLLEDLFGRKVDLVIFEAIKPRLKARILGSVKYAA